MAWSSGECAACSPMTRPGPQPTCRWQYPACRPGRACVYAGQSLFYLTAAEYRIGAWDDALLHGELAVSLAHDTDRAGEFAFTHAYAALVPAARDWQLASAHVEASRAAARTATATGKTARGDGPRRARVRPR